MCKACSKTLFLPWSKSHASHLLILFQSKHTRSLGGGGAAHSQHSRAKAKGTRLRKCWGPHSLLSPLELPLQMILVRQCQQRFLSLIHKTVMETTDPLLWNHLVPNESHKLLTWFSTANQFLRDQWLPTHWKENARMTVLDEVMFLLNFLRTDFATDISA